MKAEDILKKYWGFDSFRKNQSEIVSSVINGHDTLALLPTGGGKSICFQVPGIARDGVCLVISPLIALMQDQVENLKKRGLKAYSINSGMSRREIDIILDNAKFGEVDFLYVSPERLQTDLFLARFKQMKIGLIAIDEAHCISQWGHDFRPPYLEIYKLREIHPGVPVIAVTATATEHVKEDIINYLELNSPHYYEGSFARDNISYEVYEVPQKTKAVLKACELFKGNTGIVYCQTRRSTKLITKLLIAHNFSAGVYHGGLSGAERSEKLKRWLNGEIRIIVATNAFGMGIDKPDVRFVLHYEIPNNVEAYYQEAGRAGRDGKASRTMAFFDQKDLPRLEQQLERTFPPIEYIKSVYRAMCNHFSIAIGSGAHQSYGLNIQDFVRKYNFEPITAYNALKILEMNGSIVMNEAVFHPTKLMFIVNNKTLYSFQLKNDKYDPLISLLSRSYPGIFSYYYAIQERKIAQRLKISLKELNDQLSYLEKHGVIDITWQSELPQVVLLHERLPDDYMRIDQSIYDQRKKVAFDKISALKKFVLAPQCRSVLLLNYFGQEGTPCGKCDVCLTQRKTDYTAEELIDGIKRLLQEQPRTLEMLQSELQLKNSSQLHKLLHWLTDEGEITFKANTFQLKDST
ncbi:MAG: RecQ family ATP-dependent DNA helicase [Bacteroidota bacterium]